QAAAEARQRVEHDAVVVAVRVALHHHATGEAETIEQRQIFLDRRFRRRVAAPRRERKFVGGTEHMGVRVPGAGRRQRIRPLRICDRTCDQRRLCTHPSLMLPSRTTLPHFSISEATKARHSSGVLPRVPPLSCLSRSITSGCCTTAFKPALSLAMISGAVPDGVNPPCHS